MNHPAARSAAARGASRPSTPISNLVARGVGFQPMVRGVVGLVGLLALWQLLAELGAINAFLLPAPTQVLQAYYDAISSGVLFQDIAASLLRVMVGFVLASICGVTLGVVLGWAPTISDFVKPVIEGLRPIPAIAWTPIAILWFGIGNGPGYFLVFIGAVFPIFVNTYAAVRNIDRNQINAALCLGANTRLVIFDVLIPASLPVIFPGLRIGLGIGWMCVVAAELIAAQSGLGYEIQQSRVLLQTQNVLVGMITIGIIGFLMSVAMGHIERRLMKWK